MFGSLQSGTFYSLQIYDKLFHKLCTVAAINLLKQKHTNNPYRSCVFVYKYCTETKDEELKNNPNNSNNILIKDYNSVSRFYKIFSQVIYTGIKNESHSSSNNSKELNGIEDNECEELNNSSLEIIDSYFTDHMNNNIATLSNQNMFVSPYCKTKAVLVPLLHSHQQRNKDSQTKECDTSNNNTALLLMCSISVSY